MTTKISETNGTIELKIARLQRRLQVLALQAKMSRAYPGHQQRLLEALTKARQKMAYLTAIQRTLVGEQVPKSS